MKKLLRVDDLRFDEVLETSYSAAFFASGYESRCIAISERLEPRRIKSATAWGFEQDSLPVLRKAHDLHFRQKWAIEPSIVPHSDFAAAWKSAKRAIPKPPRGPLRLLVDYSSMSRIWYAAILSFLRFTPFAHPVIVDFVYTPGSYSLSYPDELRDSVVAQIVSIPGMEGLSGTRESSIAALGLGFTPSAALGVLERVQPTLIFSYFASPGAKPEYTNICMEANRQLIKGSRFLLPLPLDSVATCYKRLSEALIPHLDSQQITFIPMGPKPHVLASMFVAMKFRQVACLYARLARTDVSDIPPGGAPYAARVTIGLE